MKMKASEYYRGWLYVRCPRCGKEKYFFTGTETGEEGCNGCGNVYPLYGMHRAYANCECGRITRYLTNVTDGMFDARCPVCHAPVAVAWDKTRKIYATIADGEKRARKRKANRGRKEG